MPPAKRPPPKRNQRAAKGGERPLVNALAEAAWAEADSALAEALVECDRAVGASSTVQREEALQLLSLALSRAGRRRGLSRLGAPGRIEDFDPARHELAITAKRAPKRVRIAVAGVTRGTEVLIKARVRTVRAKGS